MPNDPAERRRVTLQRPGPLLVEGPVEVTLEDGTTVSSDRFCVALCTCRRSRIPPWCDTSHRRRATAGDRGPTTGPETPATAPAEEPRRTQPPSA
ncbi:CDGSH iron-sulfur domain-containing protein [Streptomyces sp. DSM 3412]|uniref:CDGSH iron-sulfur domain-containing protein n=1 Tax=Streptomyces gottesmaniae TaxID=3075518 RepID=A0ABU2Z288_9ACTN|nr:CDGSH iron-sulfur domain-containing protein [Streptomyces sp. DSM 3412]MDT0569759.1 CDGSH iron-sulfur domain-containing protein [Streptomyces sp. DSM 3412]